MKIYQQLAENQIKFNLQSSCKKDAIKEVATILKKNRRVKDFDSFLDDIYQRESLNTTAIGSAVALPHARTNVVSDFVIALGVDSKGIDFSATDGESVKLIFLMGTPRDRRVNNYLKILAHLTRLLQKESFRKNLINADSASEIIAYFRNFED